MGMPLYAEIEWFEVSPGQYRGSARDISYHEVIENSQKYESVFLWHNEYQSPSLEYLKNGVKFVVWFENSQSIAAKLKVQENFNIPNLAFWRFGEGDPEIWELFR